MKGYVLVILLAAAILLLLPLPALPRREAAVATPTDSLSLPDHTTPLIPPTDQSNSSSKEETFRILCGEQVVTMSEQDFLIATLAFEMGPSYHTEALKAQAAAAYTYYARRRQAQQTQADAALKGADFVTPDEKFPSQYTKEALKKTWGEQYDANYNKLVEAVKAVTGKTIVYEDTLIDACYFSISNGSTESAETLWGKDIPYLQPIASPGDLLAPNYQTTVTLTAAQVQTALKALQPALVLPEKAADWFGQASLSAAGTVITQPVGNGSFSGTQLREAFGLRSPTFSVAYQNESFTFTVKGYGHGVGMSQYGADHLARQGYSWQEILQYYYKGVTIR